MEEEIAYKIFEYSAMIFTLYMVADMARFAVGNYRRNRKTVNEARARGDTRDSLDIIADSWQSNRENESLNRG